MTPVGRGLWILACAIAPSAAACSGSPDGAPPLGDESPALDAAEAPAAAEAGSPPAGGGAGAAATRSGTSADAGPPADATSGPGATSGDAAAQGDASADAASPGAPFDGGVDAPAPKAPRCPDRRDAGAPLALDAGADATPGVRDLPQVLRGAGGVLSAPTLVSVTFPNDAYADDLDDFVASVGCTPYWEAVMRDYGVGDAFAAASVRSTETPAGTLDDTAVRAWLAAKIDGGDPQFPRLGPQALYVLFYPAGTQITLQGASSCVDFVGYHEGGRLSDGTPFSYAVVPRCPSADAGSPIDDLTEAASHEMIEATTDPQPDTAPGYQDIDVNHPGPAFALGTEVGDLCEMNSDAVFRPSGFPWAVQGTWSDSSARAGDNPCAPGGTTRYYFAAPLVRDTLTTDLVPGGPSTVAVVHVAPGTSATVDVQLASNYAAGTLLLQAFDWPELNGQPPQLGLTFDVAQGQPGSTVHLTIQKATGTPAGAEPFALVTRPASTPTSFTTFWALTSD